MTLLENYKYFNTFQTLSTFPTKDVKALVTELSMGQTLVLFCLISDMDESDATNMCRNILAELKFKAVLVK